MVTQTKVKEQVVAPEAEVAEPSAPEDAQDTPGPEATTEAEPEAKVEEEALPFKTKAELDAHIEKEAQRRADKLSNKSTITYQQKVEELEKELKLAKRQNTEKVEDNALTRLEKKQQEAYQGEEDLPDFLEAQKTLLQKVREFNTEKADWDGKREKLTANAREQLAFTKALELYLVPEDSEEFLSSVKAFAKKLAGAETDREMELLYTLEEERLKALAEAEPPGKRTAPDSGFPSASGGKDWSKASVDDKIAEGLKEERKKHKIG